MLHCYHLTSPPSQVEAGLVANAQEKLLSVPKYRRKAHNDPISHGNHVARVVLAEASSELLICNSGGSTFTVTDYDAMPTKTFDMNDGEV